jgi:hypothetical protein
MNQLFYNTALVRCPANWATAEILKQFLGNHRRRLRKMEQQAAIALRRQLGPGETLATLLERSGLAKIDVDSDDEEDDA